MKKISSEPWIVRTYKALIEEAKSPERIDFLLGNKAKMDGLKPGTIEYDILKQVADNRKAELKKAKILELNELIKLANKLDQRGLIKEANEIDGAMKSEELLNKIIEFLMENGFRKNSRISGSKEEYDFYSVDPDNKIANIYLDVWGDNKINVSIEGMQVQKYHSENGIGDVITNFDEFLSLYNSPKIESWSTKEDVQNRRNKMYDGLRQEGKCTHCYGTGYAGPHDDVCPSCEGSGLKEPSPDSWDDSWDDE